MTIISAIITPINDYRINWDTLPTLLQGLQKYIKISWNEVWFKGCDVTLAILPFDKLYTAFLIDAVYVAFCKSIDAANHSWIMCVEEMTIL